MAAAGPRIAVVGAGAVGGYVGTQLARRGHDITFIDPWPAHVEAIRSRGMEIHGVTEAEHCIQQVPALHLTEVQGLSKQRPIDIALIAMKSYDTVWAAQMIAPYLSAQGYVVSLQNCINEERIASVVGWGRTAGIIAAKLSAELYEPGRIRRTVALGDASRTIFYAGEVHGRITPRIAALGEMIAGIDSVEVTENLWGERWTKLCVNAMRNGISAASGLSGNDCDRNPMTRRLAIRIGSEAVRIGQALGYRLGRVQNVDPERLALAGEGNAQALEEVEAVLMASSNSAGRSDLQRPSMGQDMIKGRRTEIDFINGFIVDQGAGIGRAAPANAALTVAVQRVERGEAAPSPDLLAAIR